MSAYVEPNATNYAHTSGLRVVAEEPDVLFFEAKMYSKFGEADLERLIDGRGWRSLRSVREHRYFLSPGPLDFLAHHGPSFITEALPWLSQRLDIRDS